MIFVIKEGKRFCKDNKWREFASFGTFSSCVKVYRRARSAHRRARSLNAIRIYQSNPATVNVAQVPDGFTVNAVGQVFDASDIAAGTLDNYVIADPLPIPC